MPPPLIIVDLSLNKRTSLISDGVWDLGQDFLCAAQGSMGRTLGRGDNSQINSIDTNISATSWGYMASAMCLAMGL